tara:strand:+ start:1025 stop:1693 length:669 start_codon:yes stop_codon:yes gene_type:complete
MNDTIKKINFFDSSQKFIKNYYKRILILVAILLAFFLIFQIYVVYTNKQILKTSIEFNLARSSNSPSDFQEQMNRLSSQKNFYGVLATLETIKIKLNKDDINSSNDDYLKLLNQKNLNSIYVSAIATHASYSFLDKINKANEKDIVIKVNNFLSFIDSSLEFYEGFILEIQYLLSIIKQDNNNDSLIYDETQKLYQEIIDNDKVSALLKERVKTIHESQKYK